MHAQRRLIVRFQSEFAFAVNLLSFFLFFFFNDLLIYLNIWRYIPSDITNRSSIKEGISFWGVLCITNYSKAQIYYIHLLRTDNKNCVDTAAR